MRYAIIAAAAIALAPPAPAAEPVYPATPGEFDLMVRNEIAIRGKALKATGAKAE